VVPEMAEARKYIAKSTITTSIFKNIFLNLVTHNADSIIPYIRNTLACFWFNIKFRHKIKSFLHQVTFSDNETVLSLLMLPAHTKMC